MSSFIQNYNWYAPIPHSDMNKKRKISYIKTLSYPFHIIETTEIENNGENPCHYLTYPFLFSYVSEIKPARNQNFWYIKLSYCRHIFRCDEDTNTVLMEICVLNSYSTSNKTIH